MLSAVDLATRTGVTISAVTCRNDHVRWSEPEVREDYLVVLVRRGRFRRHAAGVCADLDPTVGYLPAAVRNRCARNCPAAGMP